MEVNCRFYDAYGLYACVVDDTDIIEKDHVIKEFKGVHQKGKDHDDVKYVWFERTNVKYFPRGLEKHFKNIIELRIKGCDIKEISKDDLRGLERLKKFVIVHSHLTSLPDDLFTDMPDLRYVALHDNKLDCLSSEVLKPFVGRKNLILHLKRNRTINAFLNTGHRGSVNSLEELMKLIDEKCKPASPQVVPDPVSPMVKEMWVSGRFSDFAIIAGEKNFKVHKNILGMQSEVFAKTFEVQPEANEITITDFTADSVEALLKFIYTSEISRDGNEKEIFAIADKFEVTKMKLIYEKIVSDQVNAANAWESFILGFASQEIKEKAYQHLDMDIPDDIMEDSDEMKKIIDDPQVDEETDSDQESDSE